MRGTKNNKMKKKNTFANSKDRKNINIGKYTIFENRRELGKEKKTNLSVRIEIVLQKKNRYMKNISTTFCGKTKKSVVLFDLHILIILMAEI